MSSDKNIIFQNKTGKEAHFFTCNFEESYRKFLLGIFPDLSNLKYNFKLKDNETSELFKFEKGYPYLVIIYTFDYKIYNIMYLCYVYGGKDILLKLSNEMSSSDLSEKLGYYYLDTSNIKVQEEFLLPTLKNDINQFVEDKNSIQLGDDPNKLFVNKDIIYGVMEWSKVKNENKNTLSKTKDSENSSNSFITDYFPSNYYYFVILFVIIIIVLILLFVFYFSK